MSIATGFPVSAVKGYGKKTQTAGTVIVQLIEPMANAYTHIANMKYTASTTAHTVTVLRPLGKTTFSADAAAGQAVVNVSADPGDYSGRRTADNLIAANDYVVYKAADGTYVVDTVASVSGLAVTLTTNLPTLGVTTGDPIWFFGITTDTNPDDAQAHPQFTTTASATQTYADASASGLPVVSSLREYQPMLVHSNNATAAGTLEQVVALYSKRGVPNAISN